MATVRLIAPDFGPLQKIIRDARQVLGSPRPLLKAFGVAVLGHIDETFREGGRPKWKPLASSTVAARRQGRGSGSARPLQDRGDYRRSFDLNVDNQRATVFSRDAKAVWHEFGTKRPGPRPYDIVAKPGKALAIPTGPYTLSGLGRSQPTGRGSFTFAPVAGQSIPKRLRGRVGKAVVPYKSVIFRKKVRHPGLTPRPVLPTDAQVVPLLERTGRDFLAHIGLRAR